MHAMSGSIIVLVKQIAANETTFSGAQLMRQCLSYLYTYFDQHRVDIIDQVECAVHDKLHIYPLFGICYFPWHKHRIEGTNVF